MTEPRSAKPLRLAEKLLRIRRDLGLSQTAMLARLGCENRLFRSNISQYERGSREPSLITLLDYARLANVYVDVLIDDALDLPETLPCRQKSAGIKNYTAK